MPSRRKRKKKAQGSASKEAREGESRDYPPESNDNPRLQWVTEEDERSAESLRRSLWPVDADFVDATRHAQDNEVHGGDDPWRDGSAYGQRLDELEGQDRNPGGAEFENRPGLEDRNDQYWDWWSLYVTKFKQLCSEVKLILARLWLALVPLVVSLCRFLRPHLVSLCRLLFRLCLDLCLFLRRGFAKLRRELSSWILKELRKRRLQYRGERGWNEPYYDRRCGDKAHGSRRTRSLDDILVDLLVPSNGSDRELILARFLVRLFWFLVRLLCSGPTVFIFLVSLPAQFNGKFIFVSAKELIAFFVICCAILSCVFSMQKLFWSGLTSLVISWTLLNRGK